MKHRQWQLYRVFAGTGAKGNIAAVTLLEGEPGKDDVGNLAGLPASVVTLLWQDGRPGYRVRWLDRHGAIQRCGHGGLAAAAYLFSIGDGSPLTSHLRTDRGEQLPIAANSEDLCRLQLPEYGPLIDSARSRKVAALLRSRNAAEVGGAAGYVVVELSDISSLHGFSFPPALVGLLAPAALIVCSTGAEQVLAFRYFRVTAENGIVEDAATGSALPALLKFYHWPVGAPAAVSQCSANGGRFRCRRRSDGTVLVESKVRWLGPAP